MSLFKPKMDQVFHVAPYKEINVHLKKGGSVCDLSCSQPAGGALNLLASRSVYSFGLFFKTQSVFANCSHHTAKERQSVRQCAETFLSWFHKICSGCWKSHILRHYVLYVIDDIHQFGSESQHLDIEKKIFQRIPEDKLFFSLNIRHSSDFPWKISPTYRKWFTPWSTTVFLNLVKDNLPKNMKSWTTSKDREGPTERITESEVRSAAIRAESWFTANTNQRLIFKKLILVFWAAHSGTWKHQLQIPVNF